MSVRWRVGIGAVALVLGLWWLARAPERSGGKLEARESPRALTTEVELTPLVQPEAGLAEAGGSARVAPSQAEEPALEFGLRVRVRSALDGRALGGARVTVLDARVPNSAHDRVWNGELEIRELFGQYGRRFLADSSGLVVLPAPVEFATCLGEAEGLRGARTFLLDSSGEQVLELGPEPALRVQAVNPRGEAVPGLALWVQSSSSSTPVSLLPLYGVVTDGSGFASLDWLPVALALEELEEPRRLWLRPQIAGEASTAFPIDPAGGGVLEVVVPDCGELEVSLQDESGNPWLEETRLELRATTTDEGLVRHATAGYALFPHVTLEREWILAASSTFRDFEKLVVRGPSHVGERRHVKLTATTRRPRLRLRLVNAAGLPVRHAHFYATVVQGEERRLFGPEATDEEGGLEFPWSGGLRAEARIEVREASASGAGRHAEWRAEEALRNEDLDLGPLVLAESELLCAGTVVDERGNALENVALSLGTETTCFTGRGGAFELRGVHDKATLAPRLLGFRILSENPGGIPRGSRDVRLVATAAGFVSGTIRVGFEVPTGALTVQARRLRDGALLNKGQVRESGSFLVGELVSGTYDLELACEQDPQGLPLLQNLSVAFQPGERVDLGVLDVGTALHRLDLELTTGAGELDPGPALASLRLPGATTPWFVRSFEAGRLSTVTRAPEHDLCVEAEGFQRVERARVSGEVRVELVPQR